MTTTETVLAAARKQRTGYPSYFVPEAPDFVLRRLSYQLPRHEAEEAFAKCTPVTMMSGRAYRSFLVEGEYLTFWDTGPTWHDTFASDPAAARLYNDKRLFGDRAMNTVFAALMTSADVYDVPQAKPEPLRKHLMQYTGGLPGKLIQWKPEALVDCSFTYGDSQQNIIAFPFSPQRLMAYVAAVKFSLWLHDGRTFGKQTSKTFLKLRSDLFKRVPVQDAVPSLMAAFIGDGQNRHPYFEIQFHNGVTPDDIEAIL